MKKGRGRRFIIAIIIFGLLALGAYFLKRSIGPINQPPDGDPGIPPSATDQNPAQDPVIARLDLPEGFYMEPFTKDAKGARVMIFDSNGRMLVSQTGEGRISVFEDNNQDGIADTRRSLVISLNKPHGLFLDCDSNSDQTQACKLYVAEHSKLTVFDYDLATGTAVNPKKLLDIPAKATDRHVTRTLQPIAEYSQGNKVLLISVGSSCNVCVENDSMRGRIMAYNINTGKISEYARGLRNAVFMTLGPDGQVWATEMGRDNLGDDTPPDEINIIKPAHHYGWPNCYGKNIHDDQFDKNTYIRNPCMEPFETSSHIDLQAHSAPLGLAFVPESWGEFSGDLLVAYHGSWNRSVPTGYKIARIDFGSSGEPTEPVDFVSGWLTASGDKLGRPAGLVFGPDQALYISDDDSGVIYRMARLP